MSNWHSLHVMETTALKKKSKRRPWKLKFLYSQSPNCDRELTGPLKKRKTRTEGWLCSPPPTSRASNGLTQSWQGSATKAALCSTVSAMATLGNRSGSLQDGAIVPSGLFSSQKGTPLLVHPMSSPNMRSHRDPSVERWSSPVRINDCHKSYNYWCLMMIVWTIYIRRQLFDLKQEIKGIVKLLKPIIAYKNISQRRIRSYKVHLLLWRVVT